jgi:exopolysaccharide biosynthesis polyprenyl glycosylphosphotransferase
MIKSRRHPGYKYLLAALDWLTLFAAFVIALRMRGRWAFGDVQGTLTNHTAEVVFLAFYSVLAILIFQHHNLYKINVFITLVDHTLRLAKSVVIVVAGLALLAFFLRTPWIVDSRLAILYFALLAMGLLLVVRVIVFRKLYIWLSQNKVLHRNVLIVGAGRTGKNLAVNLSWKNDTGHHVVGFLDDDAPIGQAIFGGAKVIGRTEEINDAVPALGVEEVIICLDTTDHPHFMNVMEEAIATRAMVKIASPLYDVIPSRLFVEQYGNVPVVGVSQSGVGRINETYKRVLDLVLVSIGLILLSPLFLLLAALIKLDSRGPVIFRQVRIGKNGKPFNFYKFRSMMVGSEEDGHHREKVADFIRSKEKVDPSWEGSLKIVNEERITRVGKLLRRLSLDELPQLLNVLRGEMTLVGPRPCLPYEWEHYEEWHKRRLSVLPGCTGMWQVSGRSIVSFEDMVILDLYYIQNASPLLDLRLMVKTIPVMIFGSGAK